MQLSNLWLATMTALLLSSRAHADTNAELQRQVRAAETAFAQTMAARDAHAFASFLADDAVFFGQTVLRGKAAVVAGWQALFDAPRAPFSWKAESVEVLASGTLAHSSGPVFDAQGQRIATFNSIWRREPGGDWRVVFDKGCDACHCTGTESVAATSPP